MMGVREDKVDHLVNMKYIGEQDTFVLGWSAIVLESDRMRRSVNILTIYLRELQIQLGNTSKFSWIKLTTQSG